MSLQSLPIYLINIDRASDRLQEITRHSESLGLAVTRVRGVDGSLVPTEQWIDVDHHGFFIRNGRNALPGEYGCYRSHVKALERLLESGADAAIIIEDDVHLDGNLLDRALALRALAPEAEVIKLVSHRVRWFRRLSKSALGDVLGVCRFGPQGSAACYLVTRSGAQKLLSTARRMTLPWDIALERGWATGARVLSTQRDLVTFNSLRKATFIATRQDYASAKVGGWRKCPTHLFRTIEAFRRLFHTSFG